MQLTRPALNCLKVRSRSRDHMQQIAQFEIDNLPTDSAAAAVRYVVLGTVLIEPLILALRRIAEQEASARRFG